MNTDPHVITTTYPNGYQDGVEKLAHWFCTDCGVGGKALIPIEADTLEALRDLAACGVPLCDCEGD